MYGEEKMVIWGSKWSLQSYNFLGVMEAWSMAPRSGVLQGRDVGFIGSTGREDKESGLSLMHLECMELSLRIDKGEYGLGLKGGQAKGDVIAGVC